MEYAFLKLGTKRGFIDIANGINMDSTNPVKFVPLSQISRNITLALNSGLLLQISAKEYEESTAISQVSDILIQPDQYSFFPTLDSMVNVIDRLNVTHYQILSSSPELKFKSYPNYIVKVINNEFYLFKPLNGADAVISFDDGPSYWQYTGGNYPLGTWTKFVNTILS